MTMNEHLESDTGEEKQRQEDNIANLDSSLTDEIIPTVPQDLKTNGNLYFCEYCDKALTGFKSYYLHFRKHAIGSQSSLNQDKPTTGKVSSFNNPTQFWKIFYPLPEPVDHLYSLLLIPYLT
jgi:hypothetical protein